MENENTQLPGGFPPEPTGPTKQDPYCPVQAVPEPPQPGDPYVRYDYFHYDPVERVVVSHGSMLPYEAWLNAKMRDCCYLMGGGQAGVHYVDDQCQVQVRPSMPVTVDGLTLRGVPAGASVEVGAYNATADGSDIELEFPAPGTYTVRIYLLPYLPWSTSLEVQDTDTV